MRNVALISAASAAIGYAAVHVAFFAKPTPAPAPAAPAAQAPAEPVTLAGVIEVNDTDTLLDARPKEPDGAPFEPIVPASFTAPAAVPPIPPATDDPGTEPGRGM